MEVFFLDKFSLIPICSLSLFLDGLLSHAATSLILVMARKYRSFSRRRRRSTRVSSRSRRVRYASRKNRRVVPSGRNIARLSTRRMAIRSFLTRRRIVAVEYSPGSAVYAYGQPFIHQCGEGIPGNTGSSAANYRFREIGFGSSYQSSSADNYPSPLFNCYPPSGYVTKTSDVVRVVRGITRLSLRISPYSTAAWPAADEIHYGLNPNFPSHLVVRVVGFRVYLDANSTSPGTIFLPSYLPTGTGYYNNFVENYFNTEDVWECKGSEHWVNARVPDYTDPHQHDRTKNKRLVYDKKFMLSRSTLTGEPSNTERNNGSIRASGSESHTLVIRYPPHTIKGVSSTDARLRESHYRFFFCVYQPGTTCSGAWSGLDDPAGVGAIGPTQIQFEAKSKFWFVVSE